MARTPAVRPFGEIEAETVDESNRVNQLEAQIQELDEWWQTVLHVATQVEPLELRRKFLSLVNDSHGAKHQCSKLLNEKKACEEELLQYKFESVREQEVLKQEIAKLKEDFDAVQHQNTSLLQQLHDHNMVSSGDEATTAMSRKRPRVQNPHQEANSLDGPSCRQVRSGFSREKIKAVLGGFDRGWGSTKSRPQSKHARYTHHVLLDVKAHLFGQSPSPKQDVAQVVYGFGQMDNDIISEDITFPLFVRDPEVNSSSFTYLGNYTAMKLDTIAWERVPEEGKDRAVKAVQSGGLSTKCAIRKIQKGIGYNIIREQFRCGTYKVPCARLEFLDFDQGLNTDIQNSPRRRGLK